MNPISQTPIQFYSQASCGPCKGVERHLQAAGVDYVKLDITEDPAAADKVRELGHTGTPVIFDGFDHFQGFDIDKLDAMIARRKV